MRAFSRMRRPVTAAVTMAACLVVVAPAQAAAPGPGGSAGEDWQVALAGVNSHINDDGLKTCIASVLSEAPDGTWLQISQGVFKDASGKVWYRAAMTLIPADDRNARQPPAEAVLVAGGGDNAKDLFGHQPGLKGRMQFDFRLGAPTWKVIDGLSKSGRGTVSYRMTAGGPWRTVTYDITAAKATEENPSDSEDPRGNPMAFGACIDSLGVKR